jgi:hypothetical protein
MPDFKCAACRIRVRSHGGETVREVCPACETPMELVDALSEVVGFRSVDPGANPGEDEPVGPVGYLTDRREARVEELRVAAQRWLDDGAAAAIEPPPSWTEQ